MVMTARSIRADRIATTKSIERVIRQIEDVAKKKSPAALRKGINAGGQVILKNLRREAPVFRGNFKGGLIKKTSVQPKKRSYSAIVGSAVKKGQYPERAPGVNFNKRGPISTGISGTGKSVPMHFVTRKIARHMVGTSRSNESFAAKPMVSNRTINNRLRAVREYHRQVRHPGVRDRNEIIVRATRASRLSAVRITESKLRTELAKLRSRP